MYSITVKIAADGSPYIDSEGVTHNSLTGHMWYSLSKDGVSTGSYGFAPHDEWEGWKDYNIDMIDWSGWPTAPGAVHDSDNDSYQSTYYTGEIIITDTQYNKLIDFAEDPDSFNFNMFYDGLDNSCIDYTWKALNIIGLNPSDFEGQLWPTKNADDTDATLYKYLMGNTNGWNKSLPDTGGYDVIYGSKGNDDLRSHNNTDAIYGGNGNDDIYGNSNSERLFGGTGDDFIDGGWGDDYIEGNDGNDDLLGFNGSDTIYGGIGNDFIDGGELHDKLYGEADNDTLTGGTGNDYLDGGDGNDTLSGGTDEDVLFGGIGSDILNGDSGDDLLAGSKATNLYDEKTHDYLIGGDGFDTYYVSDQDVIKDSDGNGLVMFNNKSLSGVKTKIIDSDIYQDDFFTYEDSNGYLIVTHKGSNEVVVVEEFTDGDLGISFKDEVVKKDVNIYVGDASTTEEETIVFTVGIDNTLDEDVLACGNNINYINNNSHMCPSKATNTLGVPRYLKIA